MSRTSRHKETATVFLVCIISRLPFTAHMLFNMDSAQFALGMDEFDVTLHQPQPPGYFLYVMAARALNLIIHDHNVSLITLGIICSGLAASSVFIFTDRLFGRDAAWLASLAFITSPSMWFHSEVALSYMPEALMSVLVAMSCHSALTENGRGLNRAGVLLGLSGGIRQSSFVFLLPVFLYAALRSGPRKAAVASGLTVITLACWGIPMIYATGGPEEYLAYMNAHWSDSNWRGITLDWTLFNAGYMVHFVSAGLGLLAVPLLARLMPFSSETGRLFGTSSERYLFALWLLPAILFHLFIFTHPAVPGHSLIYVIGLILLGSGIAVGISRKLSKGSGRTYKSLFRSFTAATVAAGAGVFLFSGGFISYNGIKTHDRVLGEYIGAIKSNFSPEDTEIFGSSRFMYSFRQAMYYLPDFRVYGDEMINTPEGRRFFWGKDRKTGRLEFIQPDPRTEHYIDFMNRYVDRLPELPAGAQAIQLDDRHILVHYGTFDELSNLDRIAPLVRPSARSGPDE